MCLVIDMTGLIIIFGAILLFAGEDLLRYSIAQLIRRYQEKQENEVAFALLNKYSNAAANEQGEIIWGLVAPHQQDLSRIIGSMREDPAEELQKLFVRLHTLFLKEKFPHSNWKYWLARIVKNDLLNMKKKKNPFVSLPVEELPPQIEEEEGDEINFRQLQDAVSKLPEKQQKVIELRYLKRQEKLMTYKEIAELMECSTGQVHGYLDRAKENLRSHLGELMMLD